MYYFTEEMINIVHYVQSKAHHCVVSWLMQMWLDVELMYLMDVNVMWLM